MSLFNTQTPEAGGCNCDCLFKNADGTDQITSCLVHQRQIHTLYSERSELKTGLENWRRNSTSGIASCGYSDPTFANAFTVIGVMECNFTPLIQSSNDSECRVSVF